MLTHMRRYLATVLASADSATLASNGPAGLQAEIVACAAEGLGLVLLVPCISDQLFNLEAAGPVVVTSSHWQVWGEAHVSADARRPARLNGIDPLEAHCYTLVEVRPRRIAVTRATGWGAAETYDLEQDAD